MWISRLIGFIALAFMVSTAHAYSQGVANDVVPQSGLSSGLDEATTIRLKYAVLDFRVDLIPCKPMLPESREREIARGLQAFSEIKKNPLLLGVIAGRLGFREESELGDDERFLVYCEYKKLQEMRLEPWRDRYRV